MAREDRCMFVSSTVRRTACLVAAFALAPPAAADSLADVLRLDVLPGWRTADGTQMAGIRLTLAPGWKTYWRAPGDAGIPPEFDWNGSRNLAAARFHWPVPEVFLQNGMQSIGYSGQVVIPVELTPSLADAPVHMAGEVQIGVCEDICIPMTLGFDAALPATTARDPAIVAALIDRPLTQAEGQVSDVACAVTPIIDGLRLSARIAMPSAGAHEVVVVEAGDPRVWVSEAATQRAGAYLTADVEMVHVSGASFALDRSALRFTVLGSDRAVEIAGCTTR